MVMLRYLLLAGAMSVDGEATALGKTPVDAVPVLQSVIFGSERVDFIDYPGPDEQTPTVVLIHGGNCTAEDWSAVAPCLAKHYRVVVPDGFVRPFDPVRAWRSRPVVASCADFGPEWVERNFQARGIQYELIEEAGHWPWLEDFEQFLGILDPFLVECGKDAR